MKQPLLPALTSTVGFNAPSNYTDNLNVNSFAYRTVHKLAMQNNLNLTGQIVMVCWQTAMRQANSYGSHCLHEHTWSCTGLAS